MSEGRINTHLGTYRITWTIIWREKVEHGFLARVQGNLPVHALVEGMAGHRAIKLRGISTADRQPIRVEGDSVGGEGESESE